MNHFQAIVAALERDHPDWHVWIVPKAVGGYIWCAYRRDDERQVLNADSPDELAEYLAAEAAV
jgi:hypothetical protein